MDFSCEFIPITVAGLPQCSEERKEAGDRFVQLLAVNTDDGIDLVYSFLTPEGTLNNYGIAGVGKDDVVPSITDRFLAAFVFENEVHDLFGVKIKDIAIDFEGKFYALSAKEPMTIISPEQKAAREKAAKAAAAKAAKEAKAKAAAEAKAKEADAPADAPAEAAAKPADAPTPAEAKEPEKAPAGTDGKDGE